MILRRFPLFFAMLLLFSAVQSQIIKPVKWNSRVDKVSDTEANIVLTASIDQGWHLYSQYNPEGGSLPLVFTISPSNAFALVGKVAEYPKPTEHYEEVFKITEKFWAGKAYFTQKIKVLTDKPFDFEISLSGQACQDDGYCVQIEDDLVVKVDGSQYNKENPVDTTAIAVVDSNKTETDTSKSETATLSPDEEDAEKAGSGIWGVIIEAILWGFVALLTP
ncbi:MAG: protein-disulfide reductase DsbD family protein, partial [Bacteroidales bacterium]|nr:protein-disulfide reductase DsbD family protein [Bacteroidales bacterium]